MGHISQSRAQSPPIFLTKNITLRDESPQICPITHDVLDPKHTTTTVCGHQFDKHALNRWLRDHVTCPVCRHIVRSVPTATPSLI